MKSILVTGGLGHIGSHLIRTLPFLEELTVVDNLATQRYCSLFDLGVSVRFVESCFTKISDDILDNTDTVIHLAAQTNAVASFDKPEEVERQNSEMTAELVHRCKDRVKLFVFPSSTSVYGKSREVMYEDGDNLSPQSPYAASKLKAEAHIKEILTGSDTDYIILRCGTIFGTSPGMRFHTSINRFVYQAMLRLPLTVWKQNYDHKRPYLGLNDATKAFSLCLRNKKMRNDTFNVLTTNAALSDIVQHIQSLTDANVDFVDTPLLNQHSYEVSLDKIRQHGFEPTDDLRGGITQTIALLKGVRCPKQS